MQVDRDRMIRMMRRAIESQVNTNEFAIDITEIVSERYFNVDDITFDTTISKEQHEEFQKVFEEEYGQLIELMTLALNR